MVKHTTRAESINHYIALGRPDIAEGMKERDRRRSREFRDRYPHLVRATRAVRAALRRGDLVRPSTCSRCGKVCTPEAHHHSYEEEDLLDVEWLCRQCHAAEHDPQNVYSEWNRRIKLAELAKFVESDPEVVRDGMRPIREVAVEIGVSYTTIRDRIQRGEVRAEKRCGKWFVYPPDAQYQVDHGRIVPRRQGR